MKTPTDVYNHLQVALAHIEDIKSAKGVMEVAPEPEPAFGIKAVDVLHEAKQMLSVLEDIARITKTGEVKTSTLSEENVTPREIFSAVNDVVLVLTRIKRRIGARDHALRRKAALRIAPSHVFREAVRVRNELAILREELD